MVEFHEMDLGQRVKIIDGHWVGVEGIVVLGKRRFDTVGISTSPRPQISRPDIYTVAHNVAIVTVDDLYGLRLALKRNPFEQARESLALQEPWTILSNPHLRTPLALDAAQAMLEDILAKPQIYAAELVSRAREYKESTRE